MTKNGEKMTKIKLQKEKESRSDDRSSSLEFFLKETNTSRKRKHENVAKVAPSLQASNTDVDEATGDKALILDGTISGKKESRAQKRLERTKLMEAVPTTDEHGNAYTKQQIRRMMKRVKRGLHPIESESEKRERLKNEAQLRREEEAALAGDDYASNDDEDRDESKVDEVGVGGNEENHTIDNTAVDKSVQNVTNQNGEPPSKKLKKPRSKPVPSDYICMACQNKNTPAHWIYDCPDKKTSRGLNQVAKKIKGIHPSDEKKVFVSGLPFDIKRSQLLQMFSPQCGPISQIKLVMFPDSPGRCKGLAYITFESKSGAYKALAMNGTELSNESSTRSKALKLKITKVMNRFAFKQQKSGSPKKS